MDYGEWTENSRGTYNKWDGIARTTAQVRILSVILQFSAVFILIESSCSVCILVDLRYDS